MWEEELLKVSVRKVVECRRQSLGGVVFLCGEDLTCGRLGSTRVSKFT